MADEFRRLIDIKTGKGGVKCYCCNWTKGKSKKKDRIKLHKIARSIFKRNTKKETQQYQ